MTDGPAQQYDCGIAFIGIGADVYRPIVEKLGLEERLPRVAVEGGIENTYTATRLGDDIDQISTTAMMYIATEATMAMGTDLKKHLCAGLQRVTANPTNFDRIYLYDATTRELKQITPNGTINISLSETNGEDPLVSVIGKLFEIYRTEQERTQDTDERLWYEVSGPEGKAYRGEEEPEVVIEDDSKTPRNGGNGTSSRIDPGKVVPGSWVPTASFSPPTKRRRTRRPSQ